MMTDDQVKMMANSANEDEWDANCRKVKAAHGGEYPVDWYMKIQISGLAARTSQGWGRKPRADLRLTENGRCPRAHRGALHASGGWAMMPTKGPGESGAVGVLALGTLSAAAGLLHSWWASASVMSAAIALALVVHHWGWWRR